MSASLDSTNSAYFGQLETDPYITGEYLAEEIESLLPDIIQSLRIPRILHETEKKRLEIGIMGRKGFRSLRRSARQEAIERLKDDNFASALRSVQQALQNELQENSSTIPSFFASSKPESEHLALSLSQYLHDFGHFPTELPQDQITFSPSESFGSPSMQAGEMLETNVAHTSALPLIAQTENGIIKVPRIPLELHEPIVGHDISGLVALLRKGRLVAFIEASAVQLVDQDIEQIEIPKRKIFANLQLQPLMKEYQTLAMMDNLENNSDVQKEMRLLNALLVALENEEQWSRINLRRFHLITKDCSEGLTEAETKELEKLEWLAEQHMFSAFDLPFAELAMLEAYAASLGFAESTV